MHDFDADTRFEAQDGGRYRFALSDRWNVGPIPNGGYLIAAAAKAMAQATPHADPLTVTAHYLRQAVPGAAEFAVTTLKPGKTFSNMAASLHQNGSECCRFLAVFGTLDALQGPSWRSAAPPPMPAEADCVLLPPQLAINQRYRARFDPASAGWLRGEKGGEAELRAWMRHADDRDPDLMSLLLFADALPPPVFNRDGPRAWVPTLELTVHLRARPAPGAIRCVFRTRFVTSGLLEADGELWDARGELVALSRQMAWLR